MKQRSNWEGEAPAEPIERNTGHGTRSTERVELSAGREVGKLAGRELLRADKLVGRESEAKG